MTSPPHNSGQQQAGIWVEQEGWLARLWWRGGGWTLRGLHDYNRALHCIQCILSLSPLSLFLTDFLSFTSSFFSVDDVISMLSQTSSELGGAFCSQKWWETQGGGTEVNREQRRQGASPVRMINSWTTGAVMVSEGPAVSIMPVTHCADVTNSQLWGGTLSCSCKLAHSPSRPVQAGIEWEGPAYCGVSHIPCTHASNKGATGSNIGLSELKNHLEAAVQSKAYDPLFTLP